MKTRFKKGHKPWNKGTKGLVKEYDDSRKKQWATRRQK